MSEPFWGGHPHFTQFGLADLFEDMLNRCGEALDVLEVHFDQRRGHRIQALREPDLTMPEGIPPDRVWLPDIRRRKALVTLDEADPEGEVRAAITHLIGCMPYRGPGGHWPYGTPGLELGRSGASLKLPFSSGTVAIYTEGREKALAPDRPFWTNRTSVYHDRRSPPASDVLTAGGMSEYILAQLLADPHVDTPQDTRPLDRGGVAMEHICIELPLDTYAHDMRRRT